MSKGIEEIKDVIELVDFFADGLADAMKDDGKVDLEEVMDLVKNNPQVVLDAVWGAWNIPDEVMDLDPTEAQEVAVKSLAVIKKIADLFI